MLVCKLARRLGGGVMTLGLATGETGLVTVAAGLRLTG